MRLYASLRVTSHFTTVVEAHTHHHTVDDVAYDGRTVSHPPRPFHADSSPRLGRQFHLDQISDVCRRPLPPHNCSDRKCSYRYVTSGQRSITVEINGVHRKRSSFYFTINEVIMWIIKRLYVCCSELHSTLGDQSNAVHIKLIVV